METKVEIELILFLNTRKNNMCLYPRFIRNKKYTITKKNGGIIPSVLDERTLKIPVPCENCMECRKKKAREWMIRLQEDIKTNEGAKFITLTFSNESIKQLYEEVMQESPEYWNMKQYELDNLIATRAMRKFNERYRKKYKKALRHWTVTELGHNGTENIHLHGIIWPKCDLDEIEKLWKYGWAWKYKIVGGEKVNYVNAKTINYITKYVQKRDELYKHYKSIILTSPGIGNNYINTYNAKKNKFKNEKTNQIYKTSTGHNMSLPKYWRTKIYNDEERELLWIMSMDKEKQWVCGEEISTKYGMTNLFETRNYYRKKNRRLGYGSYHKDEDRLAWEENRRAEKFKLRIQNAENREIQNTNTCLRRG